MVGKQQFEDWLEENIVCPRDHNRLKLVGSTLACSQGCVYPVVDDIPIMLLDDKPPTHRACCDTLETVKSYHPSYELPQIASIDPYVQREIVGSCGKMYKPLINKLSRYPIPRLRLPKGEGKYFLDIGSNWGRWCISAAKLGYNAIGIDPSLDAIRCARRVAKQIGVQSIYLVADARFLPFPGEAFDLVFSYSVLQHFDKNDVQLSLSEISRILKKSGVCLTQMPNAFGLRNLCFRLKRRFRKPTGFDIRYWNYSELFKNFSKLVGPTSIFVDGFFSLNAQLADIDILPFRYRLVVRCSEALRHMSEKMKLLNYLADSWIVKSVKHIQES